MNFEPKTKPSDLYNLSAWKSATSKRIWIGKSEHPNLDEFKPAESQMMIVLLMMVVVVVVVIVVVTIIVMMIVIIILIVIIIVIVIVMVIVISDSNSNDHNIISNTNLLCVQLVLPQFRRQFSPAAVATCRDII